MDENKTEKGWSGFHRIERILWEDNTTKGTEIYGDQLVNDIKELKAKIATVDVDYKVMLTGAVDLLNEVATARLQVKRKFILIQTCMTSVPILRELRRFSKLFKPLLEKSDANLVKELEADFKSVNSLLDKHMTDKEHYKLYTDLTKRRYQRIVRSCDKTW